MASLPIEIEVDSAWSKRLVLCLGGIALLCVSFYPTYIELLDFWWNYSAYNHCILVIPIAGYLIYEKRAKLLQVEPGTSWFGFYFLAANCVLWLAGSFLLISFFQHLAAIGVMVGLIWALIGNSRVWVIAFPLFYLYFGVPAGEALVPYLRDLTAEFVVSLLRLTGIPVFMEGRYLTIPSGQFHVAKACSGINYLIATLAVGTVFAYLRYRSPLRRTFFMLLAILVPLIANGLRAYGIVMIAHLSNYKYAVGIDHYIYGWVFFGIVIFILFAIGNRFSDEAGIDDSVYTFTTKEATGPDNNSASKLFVFCTLVVLATFSANSWVSSTPRLDENYALSSGELWELTNDIGFDLMPSYAGKPKLLAGLYKSTEDDEQVKLHMAIYLDIERHGELENLANIVYDEEYWQRISGPNLVTAYDGEKSAVLEEYTLRHNEQEYIVWTWYDVAGKKLINPSDVKLAITSARIKRSYGGGAQVSIATTLESSKKLSQDKLQHFLRELQPSLSSFRND